MRVLIVDDEVNIREGLKTLIDWASLGCEVVGEAADGETAYETILSMRPDMCVMDIKMPKMDGIQVIEKLYAMGYDQTEFIILSGYGEFEYAKRAMACDVNHYVLKPIDETAMMEKVKEIAGRKQVRSRKNALAFEENLRRLLTRGLSNDEFIAMEAMGLPWAWYQVALVSISADDVSDSEVADLLREKAGKYLNKGFVTCRLEGNHVLLMKDVCFKKTFRALESLRKSLIDDLNGRDGIGGAVEVAFSVGSSQNNIDLCRQSYQEAKRLMDYRFLYEEDEIMTYLMLEGQGTDSDASEAAVSDTGALVEKLTRAMGLGQMTVINDVLEDYLAQMTKAAWAEKQIITHYVQFYMRLVIPILRDNPCIDDVDFLNDETLKGFYEQKDIRRLHGYIKFHIMKLGDLITERKPDDKIDVIKAYIKENYMKELLLEDISVMYGYNSSYLGKQFKEKVGMSFNSFLDEIRISEGKRMLETTTLKIYELAPQCGFNDPDYFATKFKKLVGMTPNQYRKKKKNA